MKLKLDDDVVKKLIDNSWPDLINDTMDNMIKASEIQSWRWGYKGAYDIDVTFHSSTQQSYFILKYL